MIGKHDTQSCWICGRNSKIYQDGARDAYIVSCPLCGMYKISGTLLASEEKSVEEWKLVSAVRMMYDRGMQADLNSHSYKLLVEQTRFPDNPFELMDALLRFLFRRDPKIGANIVCGAQNDYPAIGLQSPDQFNTIMRYAGQEGLIEFPANMQATITLRGWERLDKLNRAGVESNQAFVAMWFDESLNDAWGKGFSEAIRLCQYDPVRVDMVQHNNKICDEIIAKIRSAKFVVADFTGHRGGAYYEAGFAHGLGKPIILTCRRDDFKKDKVHFDLNHHNFIVWEGIDDLVQKLVLRIQATII